MFYSTRSLRSSSELFPIENLSPLVSPSLESLRRDLKREVGDEEKREERRETLKGEIEEFAKGQLSESVTVHESICSCQPNQLFPMTSAKSRIGEIVQQLRTDLQKSILLSLSLREMKARDFDSFQFFFRGAEKIPLSSDFGQSLNSFQVLITGR